jgi:hypothetical protein
MIAMVPSRLSAGGRMAEDESSCQCHTIFRLGIDSASVTYLPEGSKSYSNSTIFRNRNELTMSLSDPADGKK